MLLSRATCTGLLNLALRASWLRMHAALASTAPPLPRSYEPWRQRLARPSSARAESLPCATLAVNWRAACFRRLGRAHRRRMKWYLVGSRP